MSARRLGNVFRLGVAAAVMIAQFGMESNRWQAVIVGVGIAIIAGHWIWMAASERSGIYFAIGAYTVFVLVGIFVAQAEDPPRGALIAIASGSVVTAMTALALAIRKGRERKELDRLIFSEASSFAFFATMLAGITYGLLETWLEAPQLSVWAFVAIGAGVWVLSTVLLRRRYS